MDDNWMTGVLHRADERYAREHAAGDAGAGRLAASFWPTFWAVALGVPVGLWIHGLDLGGLAGPLWQTVVERLTG